MDSWLSALIADLEENQALERVHELLGLGTDPIGILEACRDGMIEVGHRFEADEYFVSDLMMAAAIFKRISGILTPLLQKGVGGSGRGRVVVGTVKGDIHNVGKDLVVTMLRAANYEVFDLGVDVPPERFVTALQETGAPVLGLSCLLTIAFDSMRDTVAALDAAGLRSGVKVMIGGGPVNEQTRHYAGADAWGSDAQAAVSLCEQWLDGGHG